TQAIELINARSELTILDVREPSVRKIVFLVSLLSGDLLAFSLNISGRKAQTQTHSLQPLTGSRTWPACVHRGASYARHLGCPAKALCYLYNSRGSVARNLATGRNCGQHSDISQREKLLRYTAETPSSRCAYGDS